MKIVDALNRKQVDSIPIWFMRQAGRYLPEYQQVRKNYTFMEMVKTPEIATEITLQPVKRLNVDAAIIFSDIMIILDGLGIEVSFAKGPPEFASPIKSPADAHTLFENFSINDINEKLSYYSESLKMTRAELPADKALLGFAGAPFTMASYLLEGKTSKSHAAIRSFMFGYPKEFHAMMDFLTTATIEYGKLQVNAGIQAFQIFESWGEVLSSETFTLYVLPYVERIVRELSPITKVIYYNKGASVYPAKMTEFHKNTGAAISVDWRAPLSTYNEATVQGNMDPAILMSTPDAVKTETLKILNSRAGQPGFIFNLGHGIMPEAKLDCVETMVQTVQEFTL